MNVEKGDLILYNPPGYVGYCVVKKIIIRSSGTQQIFGKWEQTEQDAITRQTEIKDYWGYNYIEHATHLSMVKTGKVKSWRDKIGK